MQLVLSRMNRGEERSKSGPSQGISRNIKKYQEIPRPLPSSRCRTAGCLVIRHTARGREGEFVQPGQPGGWWCDRMQVRSAGHRDPPHAPSGASTPNAQRNNETNKNITCTPHRSPESGPLRSRSRCPRRPCTYRRESGISSDCKRQAAPNQHEHMST